MTKEKRIEHLWKAHNALQRTMEYLEEVLENDTVLSFNEYKERRNVIQVLHEQSFELEMEIMHLEYNDEEEEI